MRFHRCLSLGLTLAFYLDATAALRYQVAARQNDEPSITPTRIPAPTKGESSLAASSAPSSKPSERDTQSASPTEQASRTPTDTVRSSSIIVTTSTVIQAPATTASNEPLPTGSAAANSASPLPIQPKITPAIGLGGVILLISGVVYTVIGIKNKWLYVFFSAAYLTSLAVTVLIVYLMNPPVTNAVQGAFFIAAFFSGLIFGALSLVFSDITDGLGCLLGGFCLSMWFLTLKEGGLISSTTGRAVFIGTLSFTSFSLSFSHYTRTYGLIASISFAGATITVLGIDCLSRAGWKEFWLYLWGLNPNTFPLNTNSYPITRAIRVEIACVILFCMFGLVSQLRLWKLVKERREKHAALRLERDQNLEREEEELGRKIEDDFARERAQWEAKYGDKSLQQDSGVGSSNGTIPKTSTSVRETRNSASESVEMVELPSQERVLKTGDLTASGKTVPTGPAVTVTVLQDDAIQQIDAQGNPIQRSERNSVTHSGISIIAKSSAPISDEVKTTESRAVFNRLLSARSSLRSSVPPPPVIVPLPFTIPKEGGSQSEDEDNASVSAVPESISESLANRRSLSKQFSGVSAMNRFSMHRASTCYSASQEALVILHIEDDRGSSIAATLDDEDDEVSVSDLSTLQSPLPYKTDEEVDRSINNADEVEKPELGVEGNPQGQIAEECRIGAPLSELSGQIFAQLADERRGTSDPFKLSEQGIPGPVIETENVAQAQTKQAMKNGETKEAAGEDTDEAAISAAPTESGSALGTKSAGRQLLTVSTDPKPGSTRSKRVSVRNYRQRSDTLGSVVNEDGGRSQHSKSTKSMPPSGGSQVESYGGSLKGAFPEKLSKVALSYRTNEWAKHLELADKPEMDELPDPGSPGIKVEHRVEGANPPVNIEITQPPSATYVHSQRGSVGNNSYHNSNPIRSSSNFSRYSQVEPSPSLSRTPSAVALKSPAVPQSTFPAGGVSRSSSATKGKGMRSSSTPFLNQTLVESPVEESTRARFSSSPSPIPSNTLMGQRETLVRNKVVSQSFVPYASTPNLATGGLDASSTQVMRLDNENLPLADRTRLMSQENMTLAQRKQMIQNQKPPAASQQWRQSSWGIGGQIQGFDSHQPKREASMDQGKREAMLASWRESMRQDMTPTQMVVVGEDGRRAAMISDIRQKELEKQHQEIAATYRDAMMDNMMRSGEMLDAHREAMRRMQANANKNI
ncbi:hypothetical protein K469DRAFT_397055 [Zopfia rhizophila CBS 207.26]|uniref:TM7S3/TM198-like domain-containing protein n=1 Tax=Zopfia rhizophila CBS 207.26 TaxID=1314779 RepID=A0A6A6DCN8_9PEZI|nr:hypothetical protein K469DRAFT_397055 [Zopfia rhizophila CBS 207.26]